MDMQNNAGRSCKLSTYTRVISLAHYAYDDMGRVLGRLAEKGANRLAV